MQESTHTDCVVINTRGYWTLSCFPPRNVCPSMRTEWTPPPPLFSQVTIAMEPWGGSLDLNSVGVEQTKAGKTQGPRGGHGETFVLVILKDYTWGWRGKKKNVLKWITEREREKNMFLFELRQWPWVTAAGLFGFKRAILRCVVPTGL